MLQSFGLGEFGLLLLLALIFINPSQLAYFLKWFKKIRTNMYRIQSDIKYQINTLVEEEETKELKQVQKADKSEKRGWARIQINQMPSQDKHNASIKVANQIINHEIFKSAEIIAAYVALDDELNTRPILEEALKQNKRLLLPFIDGDIMQFSAISDLDQDLAKGNFGILEPVNKLPFQWDTQTCVIIIPARLFDSYGGRIGRGKGYYDKYLSNKYDSTKVGVCFDVQIYDKKLNLQHHDQIMDYIISEKQFLKIT